MNSYRILSLRAKGEHALSLSVLLDGDERLSLVVGNSVWESIGSPKSGDLISDEDLETLKHESERREAYRSAMRILEIGSVSKKGLVIKLLHKGFSRESAEFAVSRMLALGYIKEGEQARSLAAAMVRRNLWGPRRVLMALAEKGYSSGDAHEAIEQALAAGEIDFSASRRALLLRLKKSGVSEEKMRATLYRYGYGYGLDEEET